MAVPLDEWLALMERDYLGDYVPQGGAAVRVVVADEALLAPLRQNLGRAAAAAGLAVLEIDAAQTKIQLLHLVFFAIAREIDWDALTQARLEAMVADAGYTWPRPGERMTIPALAQANDIAPPLLRRELMRDITSLVWRDSTLAQDFRRAMVALLDARLSDDKDGLRDEMMVGLRRLLDETQLRRRRGEVLRDLPPKTGITVDPGLTPAQREAYDTAEREGIIWLRSLGVRVRVTEVLELLLRLKQICNAAPETGASGKLDDLEQRVAAVAAAGEKSLVFSQFVQEPFGVEAIARRLRQFGPLTLVGGQDAETRAMILRRFAEEPAHKVLVLSLRAGGVGLNLTAASSVFHFDRWWTAAVEAQAEDRAHRMGQTRPVQVITYLCRDTVEERIDAIIANKQALFDLHVDGAGAEGLARLELADLLRAVGV